MTYRWTVRNVDQEAIEVIEELAETSGLTFGELVSRAIFEWHERLPFEDEADNPDDGV